MAHIFGRGLLFAAILMFGFILGIVYSNHVQVDTDNVLAKTVKEEKQLEEPLPTMNMPGIVLKEKEDYKIDMEDGEGIVIYDEDDDEIRKELVKDVDVQRDLMDRQLKSRAGNHNFFSQMGLRTADAFEGAFRSFFSLVSH